MILWLNQRFGKDWKFFWMQDSYIGIFYRFACAKIGLKLLRLSRKMIRAGGKNCSWCGAKQTRETGLYMSASKKGFRCMKHHKTCENMPYV